MADFEPELLWRLKLTFWMLRYRCDRNPIHAWRWTSEECWLEMYRDGYTAHAAIIEDMSNA